MVPDIFQKVRRAARYAFPTIPENRIVHRTSFLDGLRGVAAVIVTINHHCMARKRYFQEPFSLGPYAKGETSMDFTNPLQLPILRVLITGGAMVPIFFVISGYVLSFRQVRMIRDQDLNKLYDSLFSLAFRRPFRLFLPSIGGIVMYRVTNSFGLNFLYPPIKAAPTAPKRHWLDPLGGIIWEISVLFSGVWGVSQKTLWLELQQLWTIPLEYFGTLCVITMLVVNSRIRPEWRKFSLISSMMTAYVTGHWPVGTFFGGMLIAELEPVAEKEFEFSYKSQDKKLVDVVRGALFNIFWFMTLMMGLFIAGWPESKFEKDPILSMMPRITPKNLTKDRDMVKWFWLGIAGLQIVWCIFKSPVLQRIFTTRFALYLGDISYSLYIVHYHLTLSLSPQVHNFADYLFGKDRASHLTQLVAVAFELSVLLFVSIWQADIYWKYVDRPCVMFSKWVERRARIS